MAKLCHAFLALQGGKGLLSLFNRLLCKWLEVVYFHQNTPYYQQSGTCIQYYESQHCGQLGAGITGWPDYVGVVGASSHRVGGIIIGELSACQPTMFQQQWPPNVTALVILDMNKRGKLTNSDLEMAGLLLLW
jgi:hypothetical protein